MDFMIYWDCGSPLSMQFFAFETFSPIFEQNVKNVCDAAFVKSVALRSIHCYFVMIWKTQMILLSLNLLVMDYRPPGKKKMFKNQISWHQ